MKPLTSTAVLRIVDGVAIVLAQAMQLARVRVAGTESPVSRMMAQRDQTVAEAALLRRELDILLAQRVSLPPHRRPDYTSEQRLAILQLMRLRNWSIPVVCKHFVLHANTVRTWLKAIEGRGNESLFRGAVVWNRIDDGVRWAVHEIRRLCPEPEIGTRTMAKHLIRAGIDLSRSTLQRVLREPKPKAPKPRRPPAMEAALGVEPHALLTPDERNEVWHMDLTTLRVLWWTYTVAAILDGCTRRLLALRVYAKAPRASQMAALVRTTAKTFGQPRFLITDNGSQFRKRFGTATDRLGIKHVHTRVRSPFLNGKCGRSFRTFRGWWRFILPSLTVRGLQRKLDTFAHWYNEIQPHSALGALTPDEAWDGAVLPQPIPIRTRDNFNRASRSNADRAAAIRGCRSSRIELRYAA